MVQAVKTIIAETGRIPMCWSITPGYGSYGAIEDVSADEARAQFDECVRSVRLTQLIPCRTCRRNSGTVINITSMGGKIHTPLGGWYPRQIRLGGHQRLFAHGGATFRHRRRGDGGIQSEWAGYRRGKTIRRFRPERYAAQAHAVAHAMVSDAGKNGNRRRA